MIPFPKSIKPLLLYLILILSNALFAGEFNESRYKQQIISINPGYVFSGSGDCWGINNSVSHFKTFSPWFFHRESIDGWLINGKSWISGGYENQSGLSMSAEIGIIPFKAGERIFYLSGGGTLGYISNLSPNGGSQWSYTYNGQTQILNRVDYASEHYFSPGFTFSAGYITRVNSKIYLNLRAQVRAYNSGDILSTLSVGIGLNAIKK